MRETCLCASARYGLSTASVVLLVVLGTKTSLFAEEKPAATTSAVIQGATSKESPDDDPAEAYQELVREFQLAQEEFVANRRLNKQIGGREKIASDPPLYEFAGRFLDFARRNARAPSAVEALIWVTTNAREFEPRTAQTWKQAIEVLERNHTDDDALYPLAQRLEGSFTRSFPAVRFLRAVAAKNPNADIRGQASYSLAQVLKLRLESLQDLKGPDSAKVEQYFKKSFGNEFIEQLKQEDPEQLAAEIVLLLERVRDEYAEYAHPRGSLGEAATGELFEIRHLAVGKIAPEIEGEDLDEKPFQLRDYRGKVVLLVFAGHSRDLEGFYEHVASLDDRLRDRPFDLLGVNSDVNPEPMREMLKNEGIAWRMWRDGSPRGPIATRWNIHPPSWRIGPINFVLDHKGIIRYRDVFRSELDDAIDRLLEELDRDPAARTAAAPSARANATERRDRKIRPYGSRAYFAEGISPQAFAFQRDGKFLVTGGSVGRGDDNPDAWKAGKARGDLRLLKFPDGSEIGRFDAEFGGLWDVALSPDGKWIATAGRTLGSPDGGEVRTWDVQSRKPLQTLIGHKGWVLTVAISPDGTRIASGGFDRTVRIWDSASGQELAALRHPSTPAVLRYSGDGQTLVAGCRGGTVKLWKTDTWQERASFDDENLMLHSMDLSSDGALLVAGGLRSQNGAARSDDGILRLWDVATGAEKYTLLLKSAVTSLAFSRDRKYFVAAGHTSSIINVETGVEAALIRRQMSTSGDKIAFTPDGKSLAFVDTRRVDLWDVRGIEPLDDEKK